MNAKFLPTEFLPTVLAAVLLTLLLVSSLSAQDDQPKNLSDGTPVVPDSIQALIETSCIDCHDSATDTRLDFASLQFDLSDRDIFDQWVHVFDRVSSGEMPPSSEARPDQDALQMAIGQLKDQLLKANRKRYQQQGRAPVRRLTRLEYENTLHDLFAIGGELAKQLPPENANSAFDTVADHQGISPVHIRSYLEAANSALSEAAELGPKPFVKPETISYVNSPYIQRWTQRPIVNGGQTLKFEDDDLIYFDYRSYFSRSDAMGFRFKRKGRYRFIIEVAAYQARTPVTFLLQRGGEKRGSNEIIGQFDLGPDQTRKVECVGQFEPSDYFNLSIADQDADPNGRPIFYIGAKKFKGEGIRLKSLKVEGPLEEQWPPTRAHRLFVGQEFERRKDARRSYQIVIDESPEKQLREMVTQLSQRIFRRPVSDEVIDDFISLADETVQDQPLRESVLGPVRAMLSSPMFLFHSGEPGLLDDWSLATRLSYFLWKSTPDDELYRVAKEKKLTQPKILKQQVERMLADPKSDRFVNDFLDQWLGLGNIDATTPDVKLYPEYDSVLRLAMLAETRLFFRELLDENLSTDNLIDSDFTFLNRRLAEHYGIKGVDNEKYRRVEIPEESIRGGLLTHASILKITANGTVTSPVKRGNFVLATLLGTPANSPPPDIGSIEPDTRGTTTIRETLDAHRNVESCAVCHRKIDPPGFAMECFDPIGGFRMRYRSTEKGNFTLKKLNGRRITDYRLGPKVDASGTTSNGATFAGLKEFRTLLANKRELVARNLISNLVVYSTGAEVDFADRETINKICESLAESQFGVRDIVHAVVQSELFRHR